MTASEGTEPTDGQSAVVHIFRRASFKLGEECTTLCGVQYVPTGFDTEAAKCGACVEEFDRQGGRWSEVQDAEPTAAERLAWIRDRFTDPKIIELRWSLNGDDVRFLLDLIHADAPPVVSPVGSVPVEVPEEPAIVAAMVDAIYAYYAEPERYGHTRALYLRDMRVALAAAYPLIAARVQAEAIAELSAVEAAEDAPDVTEMRRWAHQAPDRYARDAVLAAADAVERMQRTLARVRAEERQRAEREQRWANQHLLTVMAMLIGCTVDELVDQMWMDPHGQYEITDTITSLRARIAAAGSAIPPTESARCAHGSSRAHTYTHLGRLPKLRCPGPAEQRRAAGSAVPVATPPHDDGFELCEHGVIGMHTYGEDMEDQVARRDCPGKRRPVATPTKPELPSQAIHAMTRRDQPRNHHLENVRYCERCGAQIEGPNAWGHDDHCPKREPSPAEQDGQR